MAWDKYPTKGVGVHWSFDYPVPKTVAAYVALYKDEDTAIKVATGLMDNDPKRVFDVEPHKNGTMWWVVRLGSVG